MTVFYLAALEAYDPSVSAVVTLRFANRGFVTGPADTPANTVWDQRLKQPAVMSRDAWNGGRTTGSSRSGYGDLVLLNGDGGLDDLAEYAVDGRPITLYRSAESAPTFPTDFDTLLVGTMAGLEATTDAITIKLRDRQAELDVPLQPTKYAGDTALPEGLEGTADDLKGKPKPVCFGEVKNVPAVCVNTSKLIYQVNDGPIFKLAAVYDRGVVLGGRGFSAQTMSTSFATNTARWAVEGPDGTLVVAGGDYTASMTARVDYSTDGGATWQASDTSGMASNPHGIAYGAGYYVVQCAATAVSLYKSTTPAGPWTAVSVTAQGITTTHIALGVTYANGQFLAYWGKSTDASILLTSTDASVWTVRSLTGFASSAAYPYHTTYGAGVWVVVGASGRVAYSVDVSAWTAVTAVGSLDLRRIAYANGWFIVCGSSGTMVRSRDGAVWEMAVNQPLGSEGLQALAFGAGRYLAAGAFGADIIRSADGVNWYPRANVFVSSNINYAIWSKIHGTFLLVGDNGKVFAENGAVEAVANVTALLDDANAPVPGEVYACVTGGYFRLGASPAGEITADVVQGDATANRTAGQLIVSAMAKAGVTVAYVTADIAALDAAAPYACGFWTDTETLCSDVLDELAESVGAWWGVDAAGKVRVAQLTSASGTAAASFVASDCLRAPERIVPPDFGIPTYKVILRWGKVYGVQTDVAGGATDTHRSIVGKEYREVVATDTDVQTQHLLAPQYLVDTLIAGATDAGTEAARVLALRKVRRDVYDVLVPLDAEVAALDLNAVVSLTYARYGMDAGRLFRIIGIAPDVHRGHVRLTLWG